MIAIPRSLKILVALAVALSPLRAAWQGHSLLAHDGHMHHHACAHDGVEHIHAHYHHHGDEDQHEDPDEHNGVLDHEEHGPMVAWTAPVGTRVEAAPPVAGIAVIAIAPQSDRAARRMARPPPGRHPDLHSIRTTILRL